MIITLSVWDILIICIIETAVFAVIEWFLFLKAYEFIEKHLHKRKKDGTEKHKPDH